MSAFFGTVIIAVSFIMLIGKVSASLSSFALSAYRYKMPDEIRATTKKCDVMHGFNDISKASFFLSVITFVISRMKDVHAINTLIFTVSNYLLIGSIIITGLFILSEKLPKKIYDIKEKWNNEKVFKEDHDHEVNYFRIMEEVINDFTDCIAMEIAVAVVLMIS